MKTERNDDIETPEYFVDLPDWCVESPSSKNIIKKTVFCLFCFLMGGGGVGIHVFAFVLNQFLFYHRKNKVKLQTFINLHSIKILKLDLSIPPLPLTNVFQASLVLA